MAPGTYAGQGGSGAGLATGGPQAGGRGGGSLPPLKGLGSTTSTRPGADVKGAGPGNNNRFGSSAAGGTATAGRDIRRRSHSDEDPLEDERSLQAVQDGKQAAEARNKADEDELVGAFLGAAHRKRAGESGEGAGNSGTGGDDGDEGDDASKEKEKKKDKGSSSPAVVEEVGVSGPDDTLVRAQRVGRDGKPVKPGEQVAASRGQPSAINAIRKLAPRTVQLPNDGVDVSMLKSGGGAKAGSSGAAAGGAAGDASSSQPVKQFPYF